MKAVQPTFDDLGRPLADTTFCVVDLETTGGSAARGSKITEFGAVKVRGGQVLGEFQTLVNPDEVIPAYITVLTGITDQMVINAPRIAEVLPSFLEFAAGSVLVAHNAPFDVGFLKHAARTLEVPWPTFEVVDTAVLARRILSREEVPNCKLGTLAAAFGASTTPNHRALSDARATVDVLHALFERLGPLGVTTLEEVQGYTAKVKPEQRKKRHLADEIPQAPGVYIFRDRNDDVLYVGTSRNLRARTRSYFTKSETRTRMGEMLMLAERIEPIVCSTALEARIRELRLIAAHRPPYNRRSRFPDRLTWVKLTSEPWPRLSMVRAVKDDGAHYFGPFRRRDDAERAVAVLHETHRIRQCTMKLARNASASACVLAEMGHCLSPCDGTAEASAYQREVDSIHAAISGGADAVVLHLHDRMEELASAERYEEAAVCRDRLTSLVDGIARTQRLTELAACPELVAAAPGPDGWDIHVIRYGRLAAAGVLPAGMHPAAWVDRLLATAETVTPPVSPAPAASVEEAEVLRSWLGRDGVRMVRGAWTAQANSAARHLNYLTEARDAARELVGLG